MPGLYLIADKLQDLDLLAKVRTGGILRKQRLVEGQVQLSRKELLDNIATTEELKKENARLYELEKQHQKQHVDHLAIGAALSGDMALELSADRDVAAADLNAAAAGTYKELFAIQLKNTNDLIHTWALFAPTLTPAEAVTDGDVGVPTVEGTPTFDGGKCLVLLVFDTDAGATKTYAAADEVSCQVQVAADDKLLGYTVTAATITFTVV